jgi:glycosyltransferase involved in cell wall biosynthesis
MKVLVIRLFHQTRLLLEKHGITPPDWMFRWQYRIKLLIGVFTLTPAPPRSTDRIIHARPEQKASDSAYLEELHGSVSALPAYGTHLMVDLRSTQVHRDRGVPRYALSLVIELARQCPDIRFSWLVEEGDMPLRERQLVQTGRIVRVDDIPSLPRITHYLQSCMFDRSREATKLFPRSLAAHQPRLGAILYDMIPWVLPQLYFPYPGLADAYMRAAELLPALDQLFAISECTRIDAIAFGCNPKRLNTIYGGWDPNRFNTSAEEPPQLPARYWLYIGGDDGRKNLRLLFEAFAKVRQRMADAPALVVVCSLRPERHVELLQSAEAVGLNTDGLVLTGFVPDGAMRAVIEGAIATIFPSLYEGLGLPVLESYQYGRAALVSDNSSLRELAPPECRFDANQPEAIAAAVLRFHHEPAIAKASTDYAPSILHKCRWTAAAHLVAEWCNAEPTPPERADEPLNIISSLPPDESGVALCTQKMFASAPWTTRLYVPWEGERLAKAMELLRRVRHQRRASAVAPQILSISEYQPGRTPAVWILGNSEHHIETIDVLARVGQPQDFIYLHEATLDTALGLYHRRKGRSAALPISIRDLDHLLGAIRPRNILVNSAYCSQLIKALPGAAECTVQQLFLPLLDVLPASTAHATKAIGDPLVVMHVGILSGSKRPELIIEACELIRRTRPVRLIFAGYQLDRIFKQKQPWIEFREGICDEDLTGLMHQADVGIQLRWPQRGESSGAVCQWLGLRKPVVATAGGSFNEFGGAAWLIPPESGPEGVADAILGAAQRGMPAGFEDFVSSRTVDTWLSTFRRILNAESTSNAYASSDLQADRS